MFDSNIRAGHSTGLDLHCDDIVSRIIDVAREHRAEGTAARNYWLAFGRDDTVSAMQWESFAGHIRDMRATILPLAQAIRARTSEEVRRARLLIAAGVARMCEPPCAGESCDICEHPIWHHALVNGNVICPAGREFWTVAREYFRQHEQHPGYERQLLRIIAAPTDSDRRIRATRRPHGRP